MKKEVQTTMVVLSVILFLFISSCDKTENNIQNSDDVLVGTWIDTIKALPKGYYINELIFDNNSFTDKSSSYGIYEDQTENELSGWFVRTGHYELDGNNIGFLAEEVVSWDNFNGGEPITNEIKTIIFENCTFTINDKILELNYTTYPADAPEQTKRQYKKAE